MKKIIMIAVLAVAMLALLCLLIGSISYHNQMKAIDIIGGADGPTAMLVAGDIAGVVIPVFLVGAAVIVCAVLLIRKKRNHR